MQDQSAKLAREFLAVSSQFRLGELPTEGIHPLTTQLSQLATTNPREAIAIFARVERDSLQVLRRQRAALEVLGRAVSETLSSGGRIFLCGCGATGRLSLSLEALWRESVAARGRPDLSDRVISFIAGGDYALVRSIENFEDHPEYGARQLHDLGFSSEDMLIASSEGGETPFVIGAAEEAGRISRRSTFFIHCNPPHLLSRRIERSRRVLENPRVTSFAFETGPMAITGSTRLQATTVLMLAAGATLFAYLDGSDPVTLANEYLQILERTDFSGLGSLIERESEIYAAGEYCVHRTDRYGMTVCTDTTERSPTFSLYPFENAAEAERRLSWTYLTLPAARDSEDALIRVLGRLPRPLEWPELAGRFGMQTLLGFDFSRAGEARRRREIGDDHVHAYDIFANSSDIELAVDGRSTKLRRPRNLLHEHLLLKCALNIASTLTMGRLGRFRSNIMLYVRPTNRKLVDRSIRYVQGLLREAGDERYSYEDVCLSLFETLEELDVCEPAVLATFNRMRVPRPRREAAPSQTGR